MLFKQEKKVIAGPVRAVDFIRDKSFSSEVVTNNQIFVILQNLFLIICIGAK